MTYKFFKSKIHSMLKDGNLMFDEQEINDLYTEFKSFWYPRYTVREFIVFWFAEWTIEKNGTELINKN